MFRQKKLGARANMVPSII